MVEIHRGAVVFNINQKKKVDEIVLCDDVSTDVTILVATCNNERT